MVAGILLCAALGASVGAVELVDRYRHGFGALLACVPGAAYVAVNALAAALAYLLVVQFGWTFGATDPTARAAAQVLVAGFGSMALLRSSLLVLHQGSATIDAGPAGVLDALRSAALLAVDARRGQQLLASDWTAGLVFARDHVALTLLCLAAIPDPEGESAVVLGSRSAALEAEKSMSDSSKMLAYGVTLVDQFGPVPVAQAATLLRERSQAPAPAVEARPAATEEDKAAPRPPGGLAASVTLAQEAERYVRELEASTQRGDLWLDRSILAVRLDQLAWLQPDSELAAAVADSIPTSDSRGVGDALVRLYGSASRMSRTPEERARSLVCLWDRPRGGPAVPARGGPGTRIPPPAPWLPLAGWVHAEALFALWPALPDDLAEQALSASIELGDHGDARLARAASYLRLHNVEAAALDLELVVRARGRQGRRGSGPVVAAHPVGWDMVARPLRVLLTQDLDDGARRVVWDAALDAADEFAEVARGWGRPVPGLRLAGRQDRVTRDQLWRRQALGSAAA